MDYWIRGHVKKFVRPIYMYMLNPGICFRSEDEQANFAEAFKKVKSAATDVIIKNLLYEDDWRSCTTGAWLALATNNTKFRDEIGHLLLNKRGFIGHFYALAKFGDKESARYLVEYLKIELRFEKFPWERFQDTAYVALLYIDRHTGTNYIQEINELWNYFLNFKFLGSKCEHSLASYDPGFKRWNDIEGQYDAFVLMFNFIKSI